MKNLPLLFLLILLGATRHLLGAEIYIVQGSAEGPLVIDSKFGGIGGAATVEWRTDTVFFNSGATDAQVKLLDDYDGVQFTIQPQRSVSLTSAVPQAIGLVHASVPDSVVVESDMFIGAEEFGLLNPARPNYGYGKVRLPVFASLTPASQPQVHLATFLGEGSVIPSHTNVWIYNGADAIATANIQTRRQCDDTVVKQTTVTVPARRALQILVFPTNAEACAVAEPAQVWSQYSLYTVVTVNQPSLTMVSSVANDQIPRAAVSVN